MRDFKIYTLFSGSKGNCVYFKIGRDEFLIDAGLSAKAISSSLEEIGTSLEKINSIFITHEHSDHISALKTITHLRPDISIHAAGETAELLDCPNWCVTRHDAPVYGVSLDSAEITSFRTPHDSKMSVGYIIRSDYGNVGVATDLGYMPDEVFDELVFCDYLIIEANHDIEMLKNGPYPPPLKKRILSSSGHLCNSDCASAVAHLYDVNLKRVLLAHLSEHNNTEELAMKAVSDAFAGRITKRFSYDVAKASEPTQLI